VITVGELVEKRHILARQGVQVGVQGLDRKPVSKGLGLFPVVDLEEGVILHPKDDPGATQLAG